MTAAHLPILTPRLALRELRADDWRALVDIETEEVVRYMTQERATEATARAYVAGGIAEAARSPREVYDLVITRRDDLEDVMIGRCGMRLVDEGRRAVAWYLVRTELQGQGIAPEALRGLLGFAFDALGVHRVHADCDPRNVASARVMEKVGMRREALHLEDVWVKGGWQDSLVYALLAREWRAQGGAA